MIRIDQHKIYRNTGSIEMREGGRNADLRIGYPDFGVWWTFETVPDLGIDIDPDDVLGELARERQASAKIHANLESPLRLCSRQNAGQCDAFGGGHLPSA